MSPIKTLVALAALLITAISAVPTQLQERAASCPAGSFRMKLYSQNANGQMVWNGQYAKGLGGPLGSTPTESEAASFYVDGNKNLVKNGDGVTGCINPAPYAGQPQNTTVFLWNDYCKSNHWPMVECIQTPQYNMCWAGPNNYIQQCGQYIVFTPQTVPSAGGLNCGPALNFFIQNC